MRYLLVLSTDPLEAPPPADLLRRFTVGLVNAGVLLAGELLAADGLLVELSADEPCRISDAPLSAARAYAFWIVQTADPAEAVEWVRRLALDRGRVEVRRIVSSAAGA
jgi:hypothetical protein